jgi:hypothetical protein
MEELDELLQGSTPEEKLQSAKEIIQTLEKEVFKLRTEIKRSENNTKKLQESSALIAQNQNNISSAFLLPSEFRKHWEILIMENILDLFSPFIGCPTDFSILSQNLVKTVLKDVQDDLSQKLDSIAKLLGSTEKLNDKLHKYMSKLFQDNYLTAFPCPSHKKIKAAFLSTVPKKIYIKVRNLLESTEFDSFLKNMHKIGVHMILSDPQLEIHFPTTIEQITITKPDDFYFIDGFPVENAEAIVVIPSVMRINYPYAGIKTSVLMQTEKRILENDSKEEIDIMIPMSVDSLSKNQNSLLKNKYEEDLDYPPLQKRPEIKKKRDCLMCQLKAPCAYCSKNTLLALAKRIPSAGSSQRHINRVQSNSLFESAYKSNNNYIPSVLSRRLSEAARKLDKKTFVKNKYLDKEACKVM